MIIDVPEVKRSDPKITWESFLKRSKLDDFEAEKGKICPCCVSILIKLL